MLYNIGDMTVNSGMPEKWKVLGRNGGIDLGTVAYSCSPSYLGRQDSFQIYKSETSLSNLARFHLQVKKGWGRVVHEKGHQMASCALCWERC